VGSLDTWGCGVAGGGPVLGAGDGVVGAVGAADASGERGGLAGGVPTWGFGGCAGWSAAWGVAFAGACGGGGPSRGATGGGPGVSSTFKGGGCATAKDSRLSAAVGGGGAAGAATVGGGGGLAGCREVESVESEPERRTLRRFDSVSLGGAEAAGAGAGAGAGARGSRCAASSEAWLLAEGWWKRTLCRFESERPSSLSELGGTSTADGGAASKRLTPWAPATVDRRT
jgi:hypothetical protein